MHFGTQNQDYHIISHGMSRASQMPPGPTLQRSIPSERVSLEA